MRIAMFAAAGACASLAACGGSKTSQSNNAQANLSEEGRTDPTANTTASNAMVLLAAKPVSAIRRRRSCTNGMKAWKRLGRPRRD